MAASIVEATRHAQPDCTLALHPSTSALQPHQQSQQGASALESFFADLRSSSRGPPSSSAGPAFALPTGSKPLESSSSACAQPQSRLASGHAGTHTDSPAASRVFALSGGPWLESPETAALLSTANRTRRSPPTTPPLEDQDKARHTAPDDAAAHEPAGADLNQAGGKVPLMDDAARSSSSAAASAADGSTLKHCHSCGHEKPPDEFYKNQRTPDGLQAMCKACNLTKKRDRGRERRAQGLEATVDRKVCRRCKLEKCAAEYHKASTAADRLQSYCKVCMKANMQDRRRGVREAGIAPRVPSKVCKRCGVEKPAGEFHKASSSAVHLQSYCKACVKEAKAEAARLKEETTSLQTHKVCQHCLRVKAVEEFRRARRHPDGLQPRCKECQAAHHHIAEASGAAGPATEDAFQPGPLSGPPSGSAPASLPLPALDSRLLGIPDGFAQPSFLPQLGPEAALGLASELPLDLGSSGPEAIPGGTMGQTGAGVQTLCLGPGGAEAPLQGFGSGSQGMAYASTALALDLPPDGMMLPHSEGFGSIARESARAGDIPADIPGLGIRHQRDPGLGGFGRGACAGPLAPAGFAEHTGQADYLQGLPAWLPDVLRQSGGLSGGAEFRGASANGGMQLGAGELTGPGGSSMASPAAGGTTGPLNSPVALSIEAQMQQLVEGLRGDQQAATLPDGLSSRQQLSANGIAAAVEMILDMEVDMGGQDGEELPHEWPLEQSV